MAGKQLIYRARASTLIEVLISMVVIVTVFGIAMMIFTNVVHYSVPQQRIRAIALLNEELLRTETQRRFSDQTIAESDFRIQQVIVPFRDQDSLIDVQLTAFDRNQQQVAALRKIVNTKK